MIIEMKHAVAMLAGQGAGNIQAAVHSLRDAGMLPGNGEPLTGEHLTTLLIGCAAPDQVAEFVSSRAGMASETGDIFGEALARLFTHEPARLEVVSVVICQDFPYARINYIDDCDEFAAEEFHARGFRREIVISGGLIAALSMRLHFDTESGWTNKELNSEGE